MLITTMLAQGAAAVPAPNPVLQFLPFILMMVIFYFLLIRPQQQARKRHAEMIAAIKRGDTVVTGGGIKGKVTKVGQAEDPEISVEISDGVVIIVMRGTITDVPSRTVPTADKK